MDLVDLVADCGPRHCSGSVIDVGCGDGELIAATSMHLQSPMDIGVDINEPNLGPGVHGVCADAADLPFRGGVADVVTVRGLQRGIVDTPKIS